MNTDKSRKNHQLLNMDQAIQQHNNQYNNNQYNNNQYKLSDLFEINSNQMYVSIRYLTNNFTMLDCDFAFKLIDRIKSRQIVTYGYLVAPPQLDIVKQVIGKDGCYLKLTTINTGVDFIWHDRGINTFLFWGEKPSVAHAIQIIQLRIEKIYKQISEKNIAH
jgi:hypothetical protein